MKNEAIKTLRAAKAAASTLVETERTLRARHAELLKERHDVATAHASQAECVANIARLVDQAAADFAAKFGGSVVAAVGGHSELVGHPGAAEEREVPPHLPRFGDIGSPLDFRALCAFAAPLVKDQLGAIVKSSKVKHGLSRKARAAKLAELDQELADVEAQHTELCDATHGLGLDLPPLAAVRERREAAEREGRREAQLAADRAAVRPGETFHHALPDQATRSVGIVRPA